MSYTAFVALASLYYGHLDSASTVTSGLKTKHSSHLFPVQNDVPCQKLSNLSLTLPQTRVNNNDILECNWGTSWLSKQVHN